MKTRLCNLQILHVKCCVRLLDFGILEILVSAFIVSINQNQTSRSGVHRMNTSRRR